MSNANLGAQILSELEAEGSATRKCLERIPENLYDWKPHDKSMQMGYLVLLVAEIPKWISTMVHKSEIDFATFEHYEAKNTADLVAHFDSNMAGAREALQGVSDEALSESFHLKNSGQIVMTASKKDNIIPSINHLVHHRGQLTVYMRLNNLPVPAIYGPSADDRGF